MLKIKKTVFWGFAAFLLINPLFNGVFFPSQQLWALGILILLFILSFASQKENIKNLLLTHPIQYLLVALVGVYALAIPGAMDQGLAWQGLIKWSGYFFVFWLAYRLSKFPGNYHVILNALYFGGVAVSIYSILGATKVIEITKVFINGRLWSVFQYPNSFASYLGALFILGLYLWVSRDNKKGFLYAAGNFILGLSLMAAGSRGVFMLFPVALVLFVLGLPRVYIWPVVNRLVISMVAVLVVNYKFLPFLVKKNYAGVWQWFFIGIVLSVVMEICRRWIGKSTGSKRKRTVVIFILATVVGLSISLNYFGSDSILKIIPPETWKRFQTIDIDEPSAQARFKLWNDALKIVKDRPLLGGGGGAFTAIPETYRSYKYSFPHVHNDYIEIWAEAGTIGLLLYLGFWFTYFISVIKDRVRIKNQEQVFLVWSLFAATVLLGMHSFIDYDLAFGAWGYLLVSMVGVAIARVNEELRMKNENQVRVNNNEEFSYKNIAI